jgi:hypothetical protein
MSTNNFEDTSQPKAANLRPGAHGNRQHLRTVGVGLLSHPKAKVFEKHSGAINSYNFMVASSRIEIFVVALRLVFYVEHESF